MKTSSSFDFNINDDICVRLTKTGKEILRKKFEILSTDHGNHDLTFSLPDEDENGYSKWQLWDLMNQLGKYCYNGYDPPFEVIIKIPITIQTNL